VLNRYVICESCKLLIPDADNLDEHVCEAAAVANEGDGEIVVELSASGYQCEYCNKTFAQVSHSNSCLCIITVSAGQIDDLGVFRLETFGHLA